MQDQHTPAMSNEQAYGSAWLTIALKHKEEGIAAFRQLDEAGFVEGTVALAMFAEDGAERKALLKKAADSGNEEGLWGYCSCLVHNNCPDPTNEDDVLWESLCRRAAEGGSVDAMDEMGAVSNRRDNLAESMYWYAMADAHGEEGRKYSMQGIADKWKNNGAPREHVVNDPSFTEARFRAAMCCLEIYSGEKLTMQPDAIMQLASEGEPLAAYLLGNIFTSANRPEMAYAAYNAIAFHHDAHGLKCLGDLLLSGTGTAQNQRAALSVYTEAAIGGDREAMFLMGEFYRSVNPLLAAYWYGLAHTRGNADALKRLVELAEAK